MITIDNLSFKYKDHPVFENINCHIESGKIVALLGQNGQGKTTLLKLLTGYLSPDNGACLINDSNILKRDIKILNELFFIPDSFSLPDISIDCYANLYSRFYPRFNYESFSFNLQQFEIKSNQFCHKLSHGQQKKMIIAFALATNCNTILLDESLNGLDIKSKKIFRQLLISSLNKDKLFIISTHQIRDIENLFDHIVMVNDKKIIIDQKIDSLKNHPLYKMNDSIEELYLKIIAEAGE